MGQKNFTAGCRVGMYITYMGAVELQKEKTTAALEKMISYNEKQ